MFLRHFRIAVSLVFSAFVMAGCSDNSSSPSAVSDPATNSATGIQKVSLLSATEQDIALHKVSCRGKSKHQICVLICHRPPGNPSNFKELILPLTAMRAHLNHGANHHVDHDVLGSCQVDLPEDDQGGEDPGEDSEADDSGAGNEGEDSGVGGGDETSDPDGSVSPDEGADLPVWCQRNLAVDADCDGFNDQTGESLY